MWSQQTKGNRVFELREAAFNARNDYGWEICEVEDMLELSVIIYVPKGIEDYKGMGDLDNHVSGICDALQWSRGVADIYLADCFIKKGSKDDSRKPVLYKDDSSIKRIEAEIKETNEKHIFYEVKLKRR